MRKLAYGSTLAVALACVSSAVSPSKASTISCTTSCGSGGPYPVPSWSVDVDSGITLDAVYYLWNPVKVTAAVRTLPGLSSATLVDEGHLPSGNDAGSDSADVYELHFSSGENSQYKAKDIVLVFSDRTTLTDVTMAGLRHFQSFDLAEPSTTTPLPTALPLFATVLGGFGLLGWRRKKAATLAA